MEGKKRDKNKSLSDEEVEKIFEATWDNWSSRRSCEQKHIPEYIKRQKRNKID